MTAPTGWFDDFELRSFEVNGASITARVSKLVLGEALRPALLLLHGFPQSHVMIAAAAWRTGWPVNRLFKPMTLWQAQCSGAVTGQAMQAGHFIPEELPGETAGALREFFI